MPTDPNIIDLVYGAHEQAAANLAPDKSPNEAARAFELSSATGVPAESIAPDIEGFEAQHKTALGQSIINNNPNILSFVNSHPLHGQLINDDLGKLDKFSRSYRRLVAPTFARQAAEGFAVGFGGLRGFGEWQNTLSPEWKALSAKYPFASQLWTALGFPLELTSRVFMGGIEAIRGGVTGLARDAGADESHAQSLGNELAAMAEMVGITPEVRMRAGLPRVKEPEGVKPFEGEILPPEPKPPGGLPPTPETIEGELTRRGFLKGAGAAAASAALPRLPKPLGRLGDIEPAWWTARQRTAGPMTPEFGQQLEAIGREIQNIRPWAEAGEVPPEGVSEVVDRGREESAKLEQDQIKEVLDDAKATNLKERSPDKFYEFMDSHPDGTITIDKAGIEAKPEAFDWIPDLERKMASPLSTVEVSTKDFVHNFEAENWPEVKDWVSKSGTSVEAAKEIVAYHASPHDFGQFDLSKIGTGEGAQAYAHGLYFAENPEVSGPGGEYDIKFTQNLRLALTDPGERTAAQWIDLKGGEKEAAEALANAKSRFDLLPDEQQALNLLNSGWKAPKAKIYRVKIHADPEHLLDWDKPLSEQSEHVKAAIEPILNELGMEIEYGDGLPHVGGGFVQRLIDHMALRGIDPNTPGSAILHREGAPKASEALRAAGIPGIKYLDQQSRAMPIPAKTPAEELAINAWQDDPQKTIRAIRANYRGQKAQDAIKLIKGGWTPQKTPESPQPTRNYVVFDDKLVEITHKDGVPVSPEESERVLATMRQPPETSPLSLKVLQRGRTGRPIRTAPLGSTEALLNAIQRTAGLEPERMLEGLEPPPIRSVEGEILPPEPAVSLEQVPWTAKDGNPWGMSDEDYAVWRTLPENKEAVEKWERDNKIIEGAPPVEEPLRVTSSGEVEGPPRPPDEPPKPPEEPPPEGEKPSIFERARAYGRTEKEYAAIQRLIAEQDAANAAFAEKQALRQAERENSAEWRAEADKLRPEVESEVRSRPEVAAYQFLAKGEFAGQKIPRRLKIGRQYLSSEQAEAIPAFVSDTGVHPDGIANLFGFDDGNALIDALISVERETAEGRGDVVRRLTDAEINRRLTESLGPSAAERLDEARDQVLSTPTMELLAERTMALAQRAGVEGIPLTKADMDRGASRFLADERFGSITTDRLLGEAGKVSRKVEQAMTAGDWAEAFRQQQHHYSLVAMAKESREIAKESRAFDRIIRRYWKRFTPENRPPIPSEYVNWLQDILLRTVQDRVPMRSAQDLTEAIGREDLSSLRDFVINKAYYGRDIPIPDFLLDPSFRRPLEDMTVAEARQTILAVRQLVKNGREEGKIIWQGEKRDLNDTIAKINQQIEKSAGGQISRVPKSDLARYFKAFNGQLLQTPTMLNRMDLGDAFGPLQSNILRRAMDAQGSETKLDAQAAAVIRAVKYKGNLREKIPNTLFKSPQEAWDGEKFDWSRASLLKTDREFLLGVMHNMGNADNFERMITGHGIEDPQQLIQWVNANATPEDWRYVTELGHKLFNEVLRGPRNDMYHRMYGATPKDIELVPVDTPIGRVEGWYHPIIHDPSFPGRQEPKGDTLFPDEYFFAGTPAGYTKARTNYRGPLSFKLSLLTSRIKQEIHDTAWREASTDISNILRDNRVQATVTKHYGKAWANELSDFVNRIANIGTVNDSNWMLVEQGLDALRQNVVGSVINYNLHTVEKHGITAFANSIVNAGVQPEIFAQAARDLITGSAKEAENLREWMYKESNELPRRHQNWMEMAAGEYLSQVQAAFAGKYMTLRNTLNYIGSSPVAMADLASAEPLWLAAYRTARAELDVDHGAGVYFADRAVSRTHGSTSVTFTPGIMTGNQGKKWIASVYRFANHILNRQYENAWQAGSSTGLLGAAAKSAAPTVAVMAAAFFTYYILPGIIDEMVSPSEGKLPGLEKGSVTDDMARYVGLSTSMGVPFARDVVRAITNNDDPSLGITNIPLKDINDLVRDLKNKDLGLDEAHAGKTLKHLITLSGALTGIGGVQIGKGAQYFTDYLHGKQIPNDFADIYRGVTKGEQRPPSGPDLIERLIVNLGGGRYRQRRIKR